MNRKNKAWIRSLAIAGAGLLAHPAFAAQEATLGNHGELYLVKQGTYGDLFPGGTEVSGDHSVLALEITRPGEATQRLLVPDTRTEDLESSPAVIFEADSNTVFLVWESRPNANQSALKLASFDGSSWDPAIEVTGNSYSKTSPQLATTRDSYQDTDAGGNPVLKHRITIHFTWSEETEPGLHEAFYTPIVLDEGTFIGSNPILSLNDFDRSNAYPSSQVPAALVRSPMVHAGHGGRGAIMVSFTSAATGRLIALEVDVLPTQLRQLADKARAYIIDLGAQQQKPDLPSLAVKARDFILSSAGDFQPEVARSMADLLQAHILGQGSATAPPSDFAPIAEKARAYVIDLGAKFFGQVLKLPAEASSSQILQIVPSAAATPATHLLQVRAAFNRPAPPIGSGTVRVFFSETGANALVSWTGENRVYYRDSMGSSGWSEVRELKLSANFNLDKAYEVLRHRVQNR